MTQEEYFNENKKRFYHATRGQKLINAIGQALMTREFSLLITDHKEYDISLLKSIIIEINDPSCPKCSLTNDGLLVDGRPLVHIKTPADLMMREMGRSQFDLLIMNVKGLNPPSKFAYNRLIDINA